LLPLGHDHRKTAVLVRISLGMFMDENQARMIEQIAVAFQDRLQLGHQETPQRSEKSIGITPLTTTYQDGALRAASLSHPQTFGFDASPHP
jgi:hypothetical protein